MRGVRENLRFLASKSMSEKRCKIGPKSIEIDKDKLRMKFSALNIDSEGPLLDFLGSRKPAHEGIKEQYPLKVAILPLLAIFRENGCR